MIRRKVILEQWINENSATTKGVVELGAGFFNRLASVNSMVKLKVGIEIYKPYIDNAKYHDCIKIHGDVLNYRELLKDYDLDTVMIIDVLEHFDMDVAFNLINGLKEDFNKILLMLPVGNHPQETDLTGFDAHEYQTHRSTWNISDIYKLEFNKDYLDEYYHHDIEKDSGCYFGVWEWRRI